MSIQTDYYNNEAIFSFTSETAFTLPSYNSRPVITLKNLSAPALTLTAYGSETIDGASTYVVGGGSSAKLSKGESGWVVVDGSDTYIVDSFSVLGNTTLGNAVTDTVTITGEVDVSAATAAGGNGVHVVQTPSATGKHNGIKVDITNSGGGDDSNSACRVNITQSTSAAIGNLRTVQAELNMGAVPASQGHTAAVYAEVVLAGAGNNATGVISAVKNTAGSIGLSTPFLNIIDAGAGKTTVVMEMGTGGALGTAATSNSVAFTTGLTAATINAATTAALKVKINGTDYWIPVATTPI